MTKREAREIATIVVASNAYHMNPAMPEVSQEDARKIKYEMIWIAESLLRRYDRTMVYSELRDIVDDVAPHALRESEQRLSDSSPVLLLRPGRWYVSERLLNSMRQ